MEGHCPRLEKCPMFRYLALKDSADTFIILYCKGNFSECGRKRKADKGEEVPDNMLPNGKFIDSSRR